ncbi:MAG: pyridoxal-phosphate-dependent aminotransferase family protein, partial [Candidatus Methanofastidiosia archaeon]
EMIILSGSGTSGMDAALSSLVKPSDDVLCVVSGKFSERFKEIALANGAAVEELSFEWGSEIDVLKVKEALEIKDFKALCVVHNESSTGVKNPVSEIGRLTKKTNTVLIADTISSMGGDDIRVDSWGIDICVSGSQKCFALPPGLAFLSVSDKAFERMEGSNYYLDLRKYKIHKHKAPFTQSISMIYALEEGLNLIFEEGLLNRIKRHKRLAKLAREGIENLGFTLFPKRKGICSETVTAFKTNEAEDIARKLKERFGIAIAGGQEHLKGKLLRVGHMGNCQERHVLATLSCLSKVLE